MISEIHWPRVYRTLTPEQVETALRTIAARMVETALTDARPMAVHYAAQPDQPECWMIGAWVYRHSSH